MSKKMADHIRLSARGIVVDNRKVLLNEFGSGVYYNIPGGGIEQGETVKEAVAREISEETGLDVNVEGLIFALDYDPDKCDFIHGKTHHVSFVFRCILAGTNEVKEPVIPDINPDDPSLIGCPKWVSISELMDINLVPKINKQLIEYLLTGVFDPSFIEVHLL
jgi:8-oxo-dGTP diphosphatase